MAGPIPSRASGNISSTASAMRWAAEWRIRASSYARASSRSTAMSMLAMSSCVSVISVLRSGASLPIFAPIARRA